MKTTIAVILFFLTYINCQTQENKLEFGFGVFPNFSLGIISNDGSVPSEVESGFQDIEIAKEWGQCGLKFHQFSQRQEISNHRA